MPGLNVGEIFARVGFRFDESDADKFDRRVKRTRAEATRPIEQEAKFKVDEASFARYEAALARAKAKASRREEFVQKFGADFDENAFREAERGFKKIEAAAGGAGGAIRGVNLQAGFFSGAVGRVAAIAAAAAPALLALAGGATALVSSLAAAAAGAGALGIGLGGIAAPVIALGAAVQARFKPIGDAITALSKQSDQAATDGAAAAQKQSASAQQVRAAHIGLADAQRNADRVQRDLTTAQKEARQELEDLARSAEEARLAQARAGISLREALQNLADVQADPHATQLQLDAAKQSVAEARAQARFARDDAQDAKDANVEATRAGVEGSARVRQAREQIADANRQVARAVDAVAEAQKGSAAAADTQSASASAAAIAMGKLSGAERSFVNTWRRVSDDIKTAMQPATDAIISGLEFAVQRGGRLAQKLARPFEHLGDAIGESIRNAARRFSGNEWTGALKRLTGAAADLVGPVSDILVDVAGILRDIAVAAIPFVKDFVRGVRDGVGKIADRTKDVRSTRDVIKDLVGHTKAWADFLGDVGKLLFLVFNGSKDQGKSLLGYLDGIVERWNDFLSTKEGQKALRQWFDDAVQITKRLVDGFITVAGAIGKIATAINHAIAWFDRLRESTKLLRHFLALTVDILTGNLPGATKQARKVLDDLSGTFSNVGHAIRDGLVAAFDAAKRKVLEKVRSILDVVEELPGIGGKFHDLKVKVDRELDDMASADSTRGIRASLKKIRDENEETSKSFEGLKRAGGGHLKDLAKVVDANTTAIKRDLGGKSKEGREALAHNFREAIDVVHRQMDRGKTSTKDGMQAIRGYLVDELRVYGFSLREARNISRNRRPDGGLEEGQSGIQAKQRGGWIGAPGLVGGDDVQIAPNVWAARGEWHGVNRDGSGVVVNRHQAPFAEDALALTRMLGGNYGSLQELGGAPVDQATYLDSALRFAGMGGGLSGLFGAVNRPHMLQRGGIVPVPGFPGERANRSILDEIAFVTKRFHLILTDAFGPGHKSPGHTVTGTAADFGGPDRNLDAAARWAAGKGYVTGYDGRFGTMRWPGHGPSTVAGANAHVHIEFGSKSGNLGAQAPRIPRPRITGGGAVGRVAQRGLDLARDSAQRRLDRTSASVLAMPVAGGGAGASRGVLSGFRRAIGATHANRTERLALWEAGLVESGLKNLNFGDADSLGALQERVSIYGRAHALDPFASATRFLRDAIGMRPWHGSAGMLAAAVQRPAAQYRGRYDQVSDQASRYLQGGGGHPAPNRRQGSGTTSLDIRSLRHAAVDRNTEYESLTKRLQTLQRQYTQRDREYDLTDEVLLDPDTGAVNTEAVEHRARELDRLASLRKGIEDTIRRMQKVAKRIIRTYDTIIRRLTRSLKHAKKKNRTGIRSQIRAYSAKQTEWRSTLADVGLDLGDARLDTAEIRGEAAEVRGTQAEPKGTPEEPPTDLDFINAAIAEAGLTPGTADDATANARLIAYWTNALAEARRSGDPRKVSEAIAGLQGAQQAGDTGGAGQANAEAIATQAVAQAAALQSDLTATRANFAVFSGTGDIGTALGANAFASVARDAAFGLTGAGAGQFNLGPGGGLPSGAGMNVIVVSQQNLVPGSAETLRATGDAVAASLEGRSFTPARTERVG